MDQQNKTGQRSIIESVVIVVSILLAFAIEAWWDEKLESITESKELERLHTEFIANRDRIDRSINSQEIVRVATENLYNLIGDLPNSDEKTALPNSMLQAMLFAPTFDVSTPVLDSLLLSGNLSVIEDEAVLGAISAWQRNVAQVTEAEVGARDFTDSELFPSLVRRGNIGPLLVVENPTGNQRSASQGTDGGMSGMGGMAAADTANTEEGTNTQHTSNNVTNPVRRNRFNDDRTTLIMVDDELKGIIAQRIREAGRSAVTLDQLEASANRLIDAIEDAQED